MAFMGLAMSRHTALKTIWMKSAVCKTVLMKTLALKFIRLCDFFLWKHSGRNIANIL